CFLRPKSRGRLTLTGNSMAHKPRIDAGYLSDAAGFDMKVMLEAVKLSRQLLAQPAFDAYRGPEVFPGESVQSDAELENFIREKAESIYHPVGTCKMGALDDRDAVVDSQCRVKGVRGLRVVDASVIPKLIGGNTNAPTIMLAERVADMIKAG
ncbi:MAG: GMC family oxidoreductase, partial [Arenimonas sp.]